MSSYLREDLGATKNITVTELKSKIKTYLTTKMDSPIESVQVRENLDEKIIERITSWQDPSLFFVVNNLYVNPLKVTDKSVLASKLSDALGMSLDETTQKLEIRKKRHLEIIRKMSVSTRDAVVKRMNTERTAIKEKQLLLENSIVPYLKIEDNLVRFYPERDVAGQITGFID